MARMMPAYCPADAPPGERAVYAALASGDGTNEWTVLHSLGIAEHVRQVEGEADFVVIVPNGGILVIEVKSHRSIEYRADGRWKLGNDPPKERSPFDQAKEEMYSIRAHLERRHVSLRSIPVVYAVWFTHVRARTMLPQSLEWHEWQVLDSEDLRTGAPAALRRTLAAGKKHLDDKIPNFRTGSPGPDLATSHRIASTLRPRFELHVVAGDERQARQSQLIHFLEEQYQALDAMADHESVLFIGPAGSGKTLLAVEAVRRELSLGRSGRFLCFNRLLGRRLQSELKDVSKLIVGTLHQELMRIAGVTPPNDASADFWAGELPERALDVVLDAGASEVRDFLVVDEVQDVASESFLDVLDLLVEGGLDRGRVLLFGDFERQAIYGAADGRELLRNHSPKLVTNRLTSNCRNLPRIGYVVNAFSRLEPGYSRFRRTDDGVDPTFIATDAVDQSAQLIEAVQTLREEGFELNEITVLSPRRFESTAEATSNTWLRQVLRPVDGLPPRPGRLQYSTIQAFKGLESPAVVVTDLESSSVPEFQALLYVAMTRATDRLFVIIEPNTLRTALGGAP